MDRLELGDQARHVITGFEGIVVAKVDYLQGCQQVCLQPQGLKEDGGVKESLYFDEPYVDLVEKGVVARRDVGGMLPEAEEREPVPLRRVQGPDRAPGRALDYQPPR